MSEFINTIDILGDEAVTDSIIDRSITEFNDDVITVIGTSAFQGCAALVEARCPEVASIGSGAFENCTSMTSANYPKATQVASNAFDWCSNLREVCIGIREIGRYASMFRGCSLNKLVLPAVTTVGYYAFRDAHIKIIDYWVVERIDNITSTLSAIDHIVLRKTDGVCVRDNSSDNTSTLIYVPSALIEDYKTATNWSANADQLRVLEDYTVDGTITGELDETKI